LGALTATNMVAALDYHLPIGQALCSLQMCDCAQLNMGISSSVIRCLATSLRNIEHPNIF
jgi:hypothetical protein